MNKPLFFLFFLFGITLLAQEIVKFPVDVVHTGNDLVGGRLAFAVKERIRKSESMRISYEKEVKATIILVTLDQYSERPGTSSCYSFVLCWDNPSQPFRFLITSFVGYCGSSRVDEVAEGFIADTDKEINNILKSLNQMMNELENKAN